METKLARIAEIAKEKPKEQFTSMYHLLNKEMLLLCHAELDANKATGIDQVTKEEYERNQDENINSLVERLKNKAYKPQPVRSEGAVLSGFGNQSTKHGRNCMDKTKSIYDGILEDSQHSEPLGGSEC